MEKDLRHVLEQNQKERRQLQKKYEKVATFLYVWMNIQGSSLFISTERLHFMQKGVMFEIKLQDNRMQGEESQDMDEKNKVIEL